MLDSGASLIDLLILSKSERLIPEKISFFIENDIPITNAVFDGKTSLDLIYERINHITTSKFDRTELDNEKLNNLIKCTSILKEHNAKSVKYNLKEFDYENDFEHFEEINVLELKI